MGTVAADVAVFGIGGEPGPVTIGATTALAVGFAADDLTALGLPMQEIVLAAEATPFAHMNGVCLTPADVVAGGQNSETAVEWRPRPRQWPHWLTTSPGKMRSC